MPIRKDGAIDSNSKGRLSLTELHCHILPGIDDGARNEDAMSELLKSEVSQGVKRIVFTPHFYANEESLEDFLKKRAHAAHKAAPVVKELEIAASLGAEVRIEKELLGIDLKQLELGHSGHILLEWPLYTYPIFGDEVVKHAMRAGLTPIFAHVERYQYFFENVKNLEEYANAGIVAQMNASTIIDPEPQKQALKLIKKGLVKIIASDCHSVHRRPCELAKAFEIIDKKLGSDVSRRLKENAVKIYRGEKL